MIFLTHPEPAISHGAGSGTENKDDHGINVDWLDLCVILRMFQFNGMALANFSLGIGQELTKNLHADFFLKLKNN